MYEPTHPGLSGRVDVTNILAVFQEQNSSLMTYRLFCGDSEKTPIHPDLTAPGKKAARISNLLRWAYIDVTTRFIKGRLSTRTGYFSMVCAL